MYFLFHPEILNPPESMVVFAGSKADFTCQTRGADIISWRVNGTSALDLLFPIHTGRQVSNITIPALTQYNNTVVNCVAGVPGIAPIESENATLLIQGK